MCPRRGTFFWRNPLRGLSCAAKVRCAHGALVLKHSSPKRRQKKATPLSASPALRAGATCGARVQRGLAQTRCAQTVASPDPLAAALLGAYRGDGAAEQPTSLRAIAALGPISRAHAPRAGCSAGWVERSDDTCGCWDVRLFGYPPPVAAPAAGRLRGGMGVVAPMLRELTRCGCLSGAATQRSEFRSAPRNRPDAGLPLRKAKGSQTWGRLFFAYFLLAKQKKVSRPPGRQPGSRPTHRHAARSTHRPRLRQAQPERTGGELDRCPETPRSIITNHYKFNSCLRLLHKR